MTLHHYSATFFVAIELSGRDKMLKLKKIILGILLITFGTMSSQVWAERLFGTTNPGGGAPSTLLEIDPATGALISTIGSVGYSVNGLVYDATTSTLYATTSISDGSFPSGLLSVDITTGAGTPIGPGSVGSALGDTTTVLLAADSAGQLYSWLESGSDDLVLWDKAAGTATVVGDSGVSTLEHGLSFDNSDTLYLLNGGGPDIYQMNTTTGASTSLGTVSGTANSLAHHGDFNPVTNLYFGLDATRNNPGGDSTRNLLVIDASTQTLVSTVPTEDNLFALAFLPDPVVAPTPTAVPTMSFWGLTLLVGLLGIFGFKRRVK
jgi:DNA-binding beta-propeller fold protein YncE